MIKFERYTVEQLKHFIWGWENLSPLRILFSIDNYKKALDELDKRNNK